ncbi:MAG: DinB family protein [bacterium]
MSSPLSVPLSRFIIPLAFVAAIAVPSRAARGQDVLDAKSATHLRDEYLKDLDTVHVKIMALANAIPAEKYSWRPATGVRSVSEALMHCAVEWYYYVPSSVAMKPPADFGVLKESQAKLEKVTAKAQVIDHLNKSWTHAKAQLTAVNAASLTGKIKPWNAPLDEAAFAMAGDMHEHLGQLIAYARSVGVKPPWTK